MAGIRTNPSQGIITRFVRLVMFSHTVFALPFALISMIVAARGLPSTKTFALIVVCMVAARNAAMAFNRLVDRRYDAANTRTANRPLPAGELTPAMVTGFIAVNALLFVMASGGLNRLAFFLSPAALGIIFFYSFTKRFTWLSHAALGLALAIAPVGAWVAVRGEIGLPSMLLGAAVLPWVAGFDILYSLQDISFDRTAGLHSLPVRWGVPAALWASRGLHAACMVLLVIFGREAGLSALYFSGLAAIAALMSVQHFLVREGDLSRIGAAFFAVNGWVGVSLLVLVSGDVFLR